MGSTGKVALSVIMGIGAFTGILCYYAFALVAPEPGKMTYVTGEPLPEGSGQTTASSSASGVGGSEGNKPQTTTANTSAENGNATASNVSDTNSSITTSPLAEAGPPAVILKIPQGASVQGNPSYDPDSLTVKAGDTITVDNEDSAAHTVTNGEDATDPNMGKLFDTSIINAGDSSEIVTTDLKPGEYPFFCSVHPYMTGAMIVQKNPG
ncbi:MAG: cupredoxin domain-containing protein [Nitrososphaeraceae archaeon]